MYHNTILLWYISIIRTSPLQKLCTISIIFVGVNKIFVGVNHHSKTIPGYVFTVRVLFYCDGSPLQKWWFTPTKIEQNGI